METLVTFLFAVALTFWFVRRYLVRLHGAHTAGASPSTGTQGATTTCPRCQGSGPAEAAFCHNCGAAFAMWRIHRAPVQSGGSPEAGSNLRPVINASICMGCASCVKACPESGALQLVNGKSILAHPERCTSQGVCAQACPTGALTLACGEALQTVRVPMLSETFESSVPGLYVIGEMGGNGLIRTSINEGRMVVEHIRSKLQALEPSEAELLDLIIVGSGPAGLSASLTAHQYDLKYLTLEQGEVASTIRHYPRHKLVMAEPVEIPLYGSLYIGDGAKETLLAVWDTIIQDSGIRLQTNERVETVERTEEGFLIGSARSKYRARCVVLALGKQGAPHRLGVPGEESSKVFYRLIEADTYRDRDILVVGGGDSALEAALALSQVDGNRVTLAHRGEDFRRARERNREKIDAQKASGKLRVFNSTQVAEISEGQVKLQSSESALEIPNDFVFVLIGGESPETFLRKAGVEIVEKLVKTTGH